MKNIKTLSPKLDVVFQALFGEVGNESITKGFLETILERKIDSIDLSRNPILRREFKDEKLGVLDIIAKLDENEICNIELQIVDKKNIIERILYYWSRLYSRQIKSGEDYKILQKAIVILITDFKIENLEELDYHSRWKIMEDKQGKKIILTQKLEIDIIELPKIIGKEKEQDNLLDWLYFLENPKSERVTEKMKENENLKEAVKKLDNLSEDEKMQRIADLRQKAIMDEKAIYEKGLEVGIEKGMKEGIQRGIEKGIEKGIMEGSQKEKIEIAKKMLELKIDKETIAKATGLTELDGKEKCNIEMQLIDKNNIIERMLYYWSSDIFSIFLFNIFSRKSFVIFSLPTSPNIAWNIISIFGGYLLIFLFCFCCSIYKFSFKFVF